MAKRRSSRVKMLNVNESNVIDVFEDSSERMDVCTDGQGFLDYG